MLSISLEQPRWPADPFISWSRFGSVAGLPNAHRAHNARHISQLHLGQLRAKARVIAIPGIGQNHAFRDPSLASTPNLFYGDFRLGPKRNLGGNSSLFPAFAIVGPHFWQIEAVGDRHAGDVRSHR